MNSAIVSAFIAMFIIAVQKYYFVDIDPQLKPPDVPQSEIKSQYDFIIVGAGSAGCVVANRLSELEQWNVLLIEAGGDEDAVTDAPYFARYLANTRVDWNYTTVVQQNACGYQDGICTYPRGHVMGGSSTINYLAYVRGNRDDYDEWARLGNTEWSYEKVLPFFIKSENASSIPGLQFSKYRGFDGPLNVQYSVYQSGIGDDFIRAATEFGLLERDYNGENQNGVSRCQNTLIGPSRDSASKAFLNNIRHRKNLDIIKHTLVTKIIINPTTKTAVGVEYIRNNATFTVNSAKEIIISAGAINSPQLLMLSGIGPAEHLESLGISVVEDLPVGRNLQDHPFLDLIFRIDKNVALAVYNHSIYEYAINGTGPLTTYGAEAIAFLNTSSSLPDVQWIFGHIGNITAIGEDSSDIVAISTAPVKPCSRGTVRLQSKNIFDLPLIDPNYLGERRDLLVLKRGIELLSGYTKTPTMKKYNIQYAKEYKPLCSVFPFDLETTDPKENRKFINCVIKNYTIPFLHSSGTVKMGPPSDKGAVVDQYLRIRGVSNLRVIDASIMPKIIRGNTNAAVIMIGEKGAHFIKRQHDADFYKNNDLQCDFTKTLTNCP